MVVPHPTTTTTAVLLALSLLGSTSAVPAQRGISGRTSGLIPKRARASSLGKRSEGDAIKPIFRLGLAEGNEVQLVHRSQRGLRDGLRRRTDILGRAEGDDEVIGSIDDLNTQSG